MQVRSRTSTSTLIASIALALAAGGVAAQEPEPGTLTARPIGSVDGAPLGYLEHLPPGYGDGEPSPLLVFLHGGGEAGPGTEATLDLVKAWGIPPLIEAGEWPEDRPFVVLSPQLPLHKAESDCAFADEIAAFLDFATQQYEVDPRRIYLTGISCGAIGIWDYLAAHEDSVVTAAVPISGHAEWALEVADCSALGKVPLWAFHGALDDIVPVVHIEGPMDRIRTCDTPPTAELELTVFPDAGHDAWIPTYDLSAGHDPYAWLLEHERG